MSLLTATTAIHALGLMMIYRGLQRSGQLGKQPRATCSHPMVLAVTVIAIVGLAILRGIEAGI